MPVLNFNNMKKVPVILFLLLCIFNLSINATELTLDERYKAAALIEVSDIYAAFPLYQELVVQGHTEAKVRLAAMLFRGLGDKGTKEEKFQKALQLLHEAADKGSIKAYYALSVMYHDGDSLTPNAELGMSWLLKAAEAGDPRGQSQLASLYRNGIIVAKDVNKALYWYKEAIKNDSDSARYNLANLYLDGLDGVTKNTDTAIDLYLTAAKQGHDDSKVALGGIYYSDKYGQKNEQQAFYWLNAAASNGNSYGKIGLASCYRYGVGTDIDYKKALSLYQYSADFNNDPTSRYRLAEMHMLGLGTKVDLKKAREIFLQLSQEGYADGTTAVAQVDKIIAENIE